MKLLSAIWIILSCMLHNENENSRVHCVIITAKIQSESPADQPRVSKFATNRKVSIQKMATHVCGLPVISNILESRRKGVVVGTGCLWWWKCTHRLVIDVVKLSGTTPVCRILSFLIFYHLSRKCQFFPGFYTGVAGDVFDD